MEIEQKTKGYDLQNIKSRYVIHEMAIQIGTHMSQIANRYEACNVDIVENGNYTYKDFIEYFDSVVKKI